MDGQEATISPRFLLTAQNKGNKQSRFTYYFSDPQMSDSLAHSVSLEHVLHELCTQI